MDYDFTLTGFRAWLESHPADDVAGYTCTDGTCPGHEFWKETLGDEYEYIDHPAHAFIKVREETGWLEQFAATLDARYGEAKHTEGSRIILIHPVTYGQCLDVLSSISTEVLPSTREETGPMIHSDML